MDIFKTKPGVSRVIKINEKNFTEATKQEPPYSIDNKRGGLSHYAVCPECDNPIQIIGLFKNTPESGRKPYGKHHPNSIPDLAEYNADDYEDCIYSNPKWRKDKVRRRPNSKIEKKTLNLLREQFDRVIYVLSKDIGIHISANVAKKMLRIYIGEEGWRYRNATLNNLPWAFGETAPGLPLFGQSIIKDGELHKAIALKCPEVHFEDSFSNYVRIKNREGKFIDLSYVMYNHQKNVENDILHETIDLIVSRGRVPNVQTIFHKTIEIRTEYFLNLLCLPPERAKRQEKFLDIAANMIKI